MPQGLGDAAGRPGGVRRTIRPGGARQNRPRPAPRLSSGEGAPTAFRLDTPAQPLLQSSDALPAPGPQPGTPSPVLAGPCPRAAAGTSTGSTSPPPNGARERPARCT
eukprot:486123-Lingulodinium_polyedra.AAC.1